MEQVKETLPVCSVCGIAHINAVHSIESVTVEDKPISGKRVFLYVTKRKVVCTEDERIRVEEFDWIRKRYTERFAETVFRLTSITTNKEAGWYLGLDDESVYRIDKGKLEELAEEKLEPVPALKNMSVDEVAWQKWHKYVTNVVDIDRKKVVWNHEGRGKTISAKGSAKSVARKLKLLPVTGQKGLSEQAKNTLQTP